MAEARNTHSDMLAKIYDPKSNAKPGVAGSTIDSADERFMRMALEEAEKAAEVGEVPIGCVIVCEPKEGNPGVLDARQDGQADAYRILSRAHNMKETMKDPTAHAEILAIRQAAKSLGSWRLLGCTLYVTLEPCVMCAGAMHSSRISRCVFGADDPKAGALETLYAIGSDRRLNHNFEARGGVLADESSMLLKRFFQQKRVRG